MRRTGRTLPSMRGIAMGGSFYPKQLLEELPRVFGGLECLVHMYGTTEACCAVTSQPKSKELCISTDVGFPATNVKVKVVDLLTREKLGPHKTGEICYRAEWMTSGYYKRPKETSDLFDEEGWIISGDAVYYDEDGRIYFVERLKQMIDCMDDLVIPAELEELLLRQYASDITEVAVVGIPHPHYVQAPAAAVVLTDEGRKKDSKLLAEEIKATVASIHALQKHLYGGVFFLDSLPKTDTGKVKRATLVRSLAGRE
ncbi:luciferin 4-monooxygenase-like [Dermacentor albipictus]|uniref:luciferin 4-monooxygenase-like n=1 Tax=Dermacentor albipictus TaxID=60249 RepID=UPI0038FC9E9D